ncbi:MAG: MYG1 family protein [Patescibacteria group bacterium]|nr:MYG1 family protein [Patescibacteria group bacterium]
MQENKESIKKLITHNGGFHSDDIFATAVLSFVLEKQNQKFEVIRTRDPEIIENGDYVYDVGGIYDEAKNRFDHHQIGGAGADESGIEYSSFGLVWKKFGAEICGSQKVADNIRKRLVAPIDGPDNGIDIFTNKFENISPYTIQDYFSSMQPTWNEENLEIDKVFLEGVEIAKNILKREVILAKDLFEAEEKVTAIYNNTEDKRILTLDTHYPFDSILYKLAEPIFIIYPRPDTTWGIRAVRKNPKSFENRKNFPASWAGQRDEELQKITGVPDAVFCHRALFLVVAKSKEGAIKLAQIAVES